LVVLLVGSLAAIAYVFAGYPAIMALLAWLRPRPARLDRDYRPSVSLIIAAHNEGAVIADKLRNVAALDYPRERLQVIVAADGSDDDTAQQAASFEGVVVLHRPERSGKLAAIERALAAAEGEVLVFSDANNMYSRDALRELVAPLADPSVGLVAGAKVIDDGRGRALDQAEGLYWRYESKLKKWESDVGSAIGAPGEIMALRRRAYRAPQPGMVTEDFVQAMLVALDGWRVVYAPGAMSVERASASIADEATRRTRLIVGRSQALRRLLPTLVRRRPWLAWQMLSHKGLRPAVPALLLVAVGSNLALTRSRRWARLLMLSQGAFYTAAAVGWRRDRAGRRDRATYLPYYFVRMNLAALRGIRDFAAGRRSAIWARVQRG
jgi:cellulose synthase/poly-beta-1,6-N-acetylglucosamine synthase-like glycosyltransferase